MLRSRRLLLLVIAAVFVLSSTSLFSQCGVERWSVKTGTDADVSKVNLNSSTSTTIANMRAFTAPNPIPASTPVRRGRCTIRLTAVPRQARMISAIMATPPYFMAGSLTTAASITASATAPVSSRH